MSDYKELLAFSIEYASTGRRKEFQRKFGVSLLVADHLDELKLSGMLDTVVVHLHGGGALPYKVGNKTLRYSKLGSLVTIGVYKKHS